MSSRPLPSFLSSVPSNSAKDRPLREEEIAEVWRHFEGVVRKSAGRVCTCEAVVDDAVQDAALFFLTRVREGMVPAAAPVAWKLLRNTGKNMARSERRKACRSHHVSVEDDEALVLVTNEVSPETATEARALLERIAVVGPSCMSPKQWDLLSRELQGELPREIQAATGMNANTVRGELRRGRTALRRALGVSAEEPESPPRKEKAA